MKIKWPWTKNKHRLEALQEEIICLKEELNSARVARFIIVRDYKVGCKFKYQELHGPISLPDLLKRIEKIEKFLVID